MKIKLETINIELSVEQAKKLYCELNEIFQLNNININTDKIKNSKNEFENLCKIYGIYENLYYKF